MLNILQPACFASVMLLLMGISGPLAGQIRVSKTKQLFSGRLPRRQTGQCSACNSSGEKVLRESRPSANRGVGRLRGDRVWIRDP